MITDISLFFLATRNSWKESIKKSVFFINNYLKEIILFLLSFLLWALAETLIPLLPAPFLFEYPEVLSVKIVAALLSNLLTYGILIYLWPYYNISKALFWKKMVQEGSEKKYNNKFQTTGSTIVVAGISICLCCLFLVNVGKDVYKGFGESQMKKYSQPIEFSMENPVSLRSPGSLSNPVSYTHLDVYKGQRITRTKRMAERASCTRKQARWETVKIIRSMNTIRGGTCRARPCIQMEKQACGNIPTTAGIR